MKILGRITVGQQRIALYSGPSKLLYMVGLVLCQQPKAIYNYFQSSQSATRRRNKFPVGLMVRR